MSVSQTDGTSNHSTSTSQPGPKWSDVVLKISGTIAVIVPVASIVWAAYTYYQQSFQQRRQDFLGAYNIVHGPLGKGIEDSIDDATKPIYNSADVKLAKQREIVDEAGDDQSNKGAIAANEFVQRWITTNILVKDKKHDRNIQNYNQALSNLQFLYRYAKTDPCTATVVLSRFHETAYLFWYYYPGSYDFDGSNVTFKPQADQAHKLVDKNWPQDQQYRCTLEPRF